MEAGLNPQDTPNTHWGTCTILDSVRLKILFPLRIDLDQKLSKISAELFAMVCPWQFGHLYSLVNRQEEESPSLCN